MKIFFRFALTLLALAAGAAWADVAVLNDLAGEVFYGKPRTKATAFMKVREGDVFTVEKGARVRVLYLASGRQESFSGPARFTAGAGASRVQQGAEPQVQALPPIVSTRIGKTLEIAGNAKLSRMGGITVRGGPKLTSEQQAELAEARKTYSEMRTTAAENDVTPELYLYSVLSDLHLASEMKTLAAEMRRRQPDNTQISQLPQ